MYIIKNIADLAFYKTKENKPIGFVPTMGALHEGHLSLIRKSKDENGLTVCSIFVNPTQFNDKKDYDKYPITIESDIEKLASIGLDVLFLPNVEEIYPNGISNLPNYDIGYLDTILDGKFRPGHFNGVCTIVHKLLDAVSPDTLYLGEKDFQQCLVIGRLLELMKSKIKLVTCPTLREANGLAMSSRNERLSTMTRKKAGIIYNCLKFIALNWQNKSFAELQKQSEDMLLAEKFELEYLLLADANQLQLMNTFDPNQSMVILVAVKIEGVRLIDNMRIHTHKTY